MLWIALKAAIAKMPLSPLICLLINSVLVLTFVGLNGGSYKLVKSEIAQGILIAVYASRILLLILLSRYNRP